MSVQKLVSFLSTTENEKKTYGDEPWFWYENANRGDCKLPQEFITRKNHSIRFDVSEAGLCEVLFYYEPNRKKCKTGYQLEYIKAFVWPLASLGLVVLHYYLTAVLQTENINRLFRYGKENEKNDHYPQAFPILPRISQDTFISLNYFQASAQSCINLWNFFNVHKYIFVLDDRTECLELIV